MAFPFKLVHHPDSARDYREALVYFESVDASLAGIFQEDFQAALRTLAAGRAVTTLYAAGHRIRWVKLRRFSHKVFFEPAGNDTLFVLAVISGKRHPARIEQALSERCCSAQ